MALVQLKQGSGDIIDDLLGAYLQGLMLRLFKNNFSPLVGSVNGDFTEADFTGYAAQSLNGWPAKSSVTNGYQSVHPVKTFTVGPAPTTTNSIYGYYVTNGAGLVIWAERDPNAPVPMTAGGQEYKVGAIWGEVCQFAGP